MHCQLVTALNVCKCVKKIVVINNLSISLNGERVLKPTGIKMNDIVYGVVFKIPYFRKLCVREPSDEGISRFCGRYRCRYRSSVLKAVNSVNRTSAVWFKYHRKGVSILACNVILINGISTERKLSVTGKILSPLALRSCGKLMCYLSVCKLCGGSRTVLPLAFGKVVVVLCSRILLTVLHCYKIGTDSTGGVFTRLRRA